MEGLFILRRTYLNWETISRVSHLASSYIFFIWNHIDERGTYSCKGRKYV